MPGEHHTRDVPSVCCAVVTVSDTRTKETDVSGRVACDLLVEGGHTVAVYQVLPDDPQIVQRRVRGLCEDDECAVVIVTGGTGIAQRDATIEAVDALLEKRLDGFGELFRMLSYQQIGAAAMLSRATAGICRQTAVFALPGSPPAVELGLRSLLLPQLGHLAGLLTRD